MPSVDIALSLSREQCLAYYQGQAQQVRTHSLDGRRVLFPANALVRVMGRQGVHGHYRLTFSAAGRFESLSFLRPLPA